MRAWLSSALVIVGSCTGDAGPHAHDRALGRATAVPATTASATAASATAASATAAARARDAASASPPVSPPPLAGPALSSLEVPGFEPAVVAVPVGSTEPRPLVVATHGNYDRPEWQCEVWSEIVGHRAFVLCPRGVARGDSPSASDVRYTYTNNQALEAEVFAALDALRASPWGPRLAPAPVVYAGFSLGAIMGVAIASRRTAALPYLVLIEGGSNKLDGATAKHLAEEGTRGILLVCAQAGCARGMRPVTDRLAALGVRASVVDAGAVGHTYDGPVATALSRRLHGFLEAEPAWKPWLTPGGEAAEAPPR